MNRKPLVWLHGEIKPPPFSKNARVETGTLLRLLQEGELLVPPESRPLPRIGARCHELRIRDKNQNWRIIYRIDTDAIVIAEVFAKTTSQIPKYIIDNCQRRLNLFDAVVKGIKK
jgi:phage-related protein